MQETSVQQFYEEKTILITGATGFLGSYLVEKLLRSCTSVKKIYLLIRPKRNKNGEERLCEFLNNSVHRRLKQENPSLLKKLDVLTGDLELPKLGLGEQDLTTVIDEVNCIFHVGATVKFTEELKRAILINIGATDNLINLSKKIKHLESLVHVSTAFSQCLHETSEEVFYPSSEDGDKLIEMAHMQDTESLNGSTANILGKWPNTYVFTKHVAEDLIRRKGDELPIAIVRPSIVVAPYDFPITSWASYFDPNCLMMAAIGLGILHSMHCNPRCNAEFIPVNFVVNHAIVAGWMIGTRKDEKDAIPIFNCVSGQENPISWGGQNKLLQKSDAIFPTSKKIFYRFMVYSTNSFILQLIELVYLPIIYLINLTNLFHGKTHTILKIHRKMKKFCKVVEFATTTQWDFKDRNTQSLWKSLSKEDQAIFNFDVNSIDWEKYSRQVISGVRVNVLQDDFSTLEEARRKNRLLQIFHYLLIFGYFTLFLFVLYKSLRIFNSFLME
ncbi:hypothetical protein RI129_012226 [Pyrocoelia pectoralis]|uniref:Fatty acyl-CoA reductase n=1 Tax=Pyrocoelia pectoralis TaxID=417401 RepID=A0AAN7V279_9COLE